jgi:hypothetical protein
MAKRAKSIEDLLAEREQFAMWLARLDESADVASDKVRDKVRDDYQKRLETVMEELGSHSDSIAEQLADHRGTQEDLTARETSAGEELAEAEVRHTVGEYDDDEWKKLKDMADEQLEQIGSDLKEVTVEIERLASVQALIAARPAADEETADGDDTSADAEDAVVSIAEDAEDDGAAIGAPKFTPRGADAGGETSAPRTLRFPGGDAKESSLGQVCHGGRGCLGGPRESSRRGHVLGGAGGRSAADQDAQVRRVRRVESPHGMVLRTVWC